MVFTNVGSQGDTEGKLQTSGSKPTKLSESEKSIPLAKLFSVCPSTGETVGKSSPVG